jgi:formylglycine-generating enzyme required for sulfatase activity
MWANKTVQRTGASRFARGEIERHRRLAPVAYLCVRQNIMHTAKRTLTVILGLAVACTVERIAHSQTATELGIETYAGLAITGTVGAVYSIEYVTNFTEPEGQWQCLEFLRLPTSPYLWIDTSASLAEKRFYRAVAMEAPANMVFIPPGTFRLGAPEDEDGRNPWEGPQTDVTISRGFWMGQHEVTQGEYLEVMGNNPSWFNGVRHEGTPIEIDYGSDLDRPVERVSWHSAAAYCTALTERERLAGRIRSNNVYRLPTEAEWEYACRAWTSTRFSYGEDLHYTDMAEYAWYEGNSEGQTHTVGRKLPNHWGLYDMHGNVSEWCQDYFGAYSGGIALDPQGPESGQERIFRGGGRGSRSGLRSANRGYGPPEVLSPGIGFRIVLAAGLP